MTRYQLNFIVGVLLLISFVICACAPAFALVPLVAPTELIPEDISFVTSPPLVFLGLAMFSAPAFIIAFLAIGLWIMMVYRPGQDTAMQYESDLERLQEITLQTLFDRITASLIQTDTEETYKQIHTWLLMILPELDDKRKGRVLAFLYNSQLLLPPQSVSLDGVDFSYADLKGMDLQGADLQGANFLGVDFQDVNLVDAHISPEYL